MKTKNKIIISIIAVALLLISYLFLTAKKISFDGQSTKANASTEIFQKTYQEKVADILDDYLRLDKESGLDLGTVIQTKESLIALKVPKEFKELHMNLLLAINKMEDFFENNNLEDKKESQDIIKNELENNKWLNS